MKPRETARILSKGKSLEYSNWMKYTQYTNDCFKQDFVAYDGTIVVCKKSHLSDPSNAPILLYENESNPYIVTGVKNSEYWELVIPGYKGSDIHSIEEIQDQLEKEITDEELNALFNE